MDVILASTGTAIGTVVSLYDGTGVCYCLWSLSGWTCTHHVGTHDVLRIRLHEGALPDATGSDDRWCPVTHAYMSTVPTNAHSEDVAKGAVRTVLLPFARDIVPEVDLDEGRMVIDPPAGLLEATLTVEKGARHVAPSKRRRAAARRRAIEDARQRAARA